MQNTQDILDIPWRYAECGNCPASWMMRNTSSVVWIAAARSRRDAGHGLRQVPGRLFRRREGSGSPGSRTPSTGLAGCRHGTGGSFPKPFLKVVPRIH